MDKTSTYADTCNTCPAQGQTGCRQIFNMGVCYAGTEPRVLVLSGGIQRTDNSAGFAMQSVAGQRIRAFIDDTLKLKNVEYGRAICCGTTESTEIGKKCAEYWKGYIKHTGIKHVILLGTAEKYILKLTGGVTANHGRAICVEDVIYYVTYGEAMCHASPSSFRVAQFELTYFSNIIRGKLVEPKLSMTIVEDDLDVGKMLRAVRNTKVLAYDIETTGLDPWKDTIEMVGFATDTEQFIVPTTLYGWKVSVAEVFNQAKLHKVKTVAHNGRFDNTFMRVHGITNVYQTADTYLMAYCLNESMPRTLKFLAKMYCGAGDYAIDTAKIGTIPMQVVAKYCALDCYYTHQLLHYLFKEIKTKPEFKIYKNIVMPGALVLEKVRELGIAVDTQKLGLLKTSYEQNVIDLEKELERLSGKTGVNWGSPKQVADILYKVLKLKMVAKGETGTGKSVLKRLCKQHDLPRILLEYRRYKKALESFIVPWTEIVKRDGRLHTEYNIARTSTGRLSAQEPNLQQVPRDKDIRSLITPAKNKLLIEADYSQIELRVASFVAGAESMKRVYRDGGDIHTQTACKLAHTTTPTKEERTKAKAANFGFLYGMGWKSFKEYAYDNYGLELTDDEAMSMRQQFFSAYPELITWHELERNLVRVHKRAQTLFGRTRYLLDVASPDKEVASKAERQAINTKVQAVASDMTVLAMILLDKALPSDKCAIVGQIHDAILIEVDEDYAQYALNIVKHTMENLPIQELFGVTLDVPVVADAQISMVWGVKKEAVDIFEVV